MARQIAILGAGPIGLEAALYARRLGHDVIVLERGEVGANVHAWGFVRLFTPWRMNVTPIGMKAAGMQAPPEECPTGEEFRDQYLIPLARSEALGGVVREGSTVLAVGRDDLLKHDSPGAAARAGNPFRILVRNASGQERIVRSDILLDCTGVYGNHHWAGHGGIPAPGELALRRRIFYMLPDVFGRDRSRFAGRHILLIGGGHSAATVLRNLAELAEREPGTRITWAIRRPGQALKLVMDDPLEQRRALVEQMLRLTSASPNWLQFLGSAVLESVSEEGGSLSVTLKYSSTNISISVDELVSLVGYRPDASIYEQLQVHQCYATGGPMKLAAALLGEGASDCLTAGASTTPDALRNPEPDFFILGAKSYGTNPTFLLQAGHKQVRDAFRLIEGNPALDLYAAGKIA